MMRTIRYSVASSLDGFIAGPNGEFDWIPMDPDIDFMALMSRYDTFLMGRKSYEVFLQTGPIGEGGGAGDTDVWVVSRTLRQEDHPHVTIVSDDLKTRVTELKSKPGKEISLWGGGELFRHLLELGLVDIVEVGLVPVLLGGGIPLLAGPTEGKRLALGKSRIYEKTGTVFLEYTVEPGKL